MRIMIAWIAKFLGHNGGMDKVFVNFSNEMTRRGHQVSMVYCTDSREGESYTPILPSIKVLNLADYIDNKKWEKRNKPLLFKVKRELLRIIDREKMKVFQEQKDIAYLAPAIQKLMNAEKTDVIVTMDGKVTAAIMNSGVHDLPPIIAMSHFNAEYIWINSSRIDRKALSECAWLQVLMPSDVEFFHSHLPQAHVIYIPNIVPSYGKIQHMADKKKYRIIDVARLYAKQKRQHLLIEAFAKIAKQFPNWQLEFWGEEQEGHKYSQYLQNLIQKYHLENQVFLRGNAEEVLSVYRNSDIFAFPSAFEGFPLAMTEAMSAGLPVVAYKSCPAVNELIQSGKNGLLVDDGIAPLAEGLRMLMQNANQRLQMGQAAHESMKPYSAKHIWDQWEDLLYKTVDNKGKKSF